MLCPQVTPPPAAVFPRWIGCELRFTHGAVSELAPPPASLQKRHQGDDQLSSPASKSHCNEAVMRVIHAGLPLNHRRLWGDLGFSRGGGVNLIIPLIIPKPHIIIPVDTPPGQ